MACIINLNTFKSLKIGSEISDKDGKKWLVSVANCGGPGKYFRHLFEDYLGNLDYIFHDGTHMYYLDEEDTGKNGSIVGEFEQEVTKVDDEIDDMNDWAEREAHGIRASSLKQH